MLAQQAVVTLSLGGKYVSTVALPRPVAL